MITNAYISVLAGLAVVVILSVFLTRATISTPIVRIVNLLGELFKGNIESRKTAPTERTKWATSPGPR